jgi:hypothetical protein
MVPFIRRVYSSVHVWCHSCPRVCFDVRVWCHSSGGFILVYTCGAIHPAVCSGVRVWCHSSGGLALVYEYGIWSLVGQNIFWVNSIVVLSNRVLYAYLGLVLSCHAGSSTSAQREPFNVYRCAGVRGSLCLIALKFHLSPMNTSAASLESSTK